MRDFIYFQDQENDELFISMVDDTTQREVSIPAVYILGKNGLVTSNPKISPKNIVFFRHMIKRTLAQLSMDSALVNIPVNISRIAPHQLNQPPWLVW